MINGTILNILGCWPQRLNMLFELADESRNIKSFNILNNMPVEMNEHYVPNKEWEVSIINYYKTQNNLDPNDYYAFGVVGTKSKEIVFNYFKEKIQMENKQFINLIHPSAYVSKSAKLDYGIQIELMGSVSVLSSIGFGTNIKRSANIGHHCKIGNYVTINPAAIVSGFVEIGNNTTIGAGTIIKHEIKIGGNSIIGSGSNVVKNIPDNVVAYGNPCIVHRKND